MKFTRTAKANWKGTGKEGKGTVSTASKVLDNTQYSFTSRFESGKGTNPEELVAAAHAGCFTMKLSFLLGEAGFTPDDLTTDSTLTFEDGVVTNIHLVVAGKVKEIKAEKFKEIAGKAKDTCPISQLLKTDITLEAGLK